MLSGWSIIGALSFKIPLLFLRRNAIQIVLAILTPSRVLVISIAVQVDPQLFFRIVLYAGVSHIV